MPTTRQCLVCGQTQTPWTDPITGYTVQITAHEFKCFKKQPELIPPNLRDQFDKELLGEKRSEAARRGVETRRANAGKRAPRRLA